MSVLEETNNSVISCVYTLRGQELGPVVTAAPDWESYDYEDWIC
jgi:elongation factor 1-gamma